MKSPFEQLKKARKKQGLSLKQVAEKTGLTDAKISRIENGKNIEPSPQAIKSLCHFYGMSVIDLFKEIGWVDSTDLAIYQQAFAKTSMLDSEEKEYIQNVIDFLLRERKKD